MNYTLTTDQNDNLLASFKIGEISFQVTYKDDEPYFLEINDIYFDGSDMSTMLNHAFFKNDNGDIVLLADCLVAIEDEIEDLNPSFDPDIKCDEARIEMGAL